MRTARPIAIDGAPLPAYRIDAEAPVMALVGILSPKLLVTGGLIDALTPEELAAAVAHELGHWSAWDNLKRLAMAASPDVPGWARAARVFERGWASAAEHQADRCASAAGTSARFALASALVKVARLMPAAPAIAEPISTLVGGGEIASRVERLIDIDVDAGRDVAPAARGFAAAGRWSVARPRRSRSRSPTLPDRAGAPGHGNRDPPRALTATTLPPFCRARTTARGGDPQLLRRARPA